MIKESDDFNIVQYCFVSKFSIYNYSYLFQLKQFVDFELRLERNRG